MIGDDQHQRSQVPPIRGLPMPQSAAEHFGVMLQDAASVADLVTNSRQVEREVYLMHIKVNLLRLDDSMAPRTWGCPMYEPAGRQFPYLAFLWPAFAAASASEMAALAAKQFADFAVGPPDSRRRASRNGRRRTRSRLS